MRSPSPRQSETTLVVRHRTRELTLAPGTYFLGRHLSCDVVIDSAHVSRRHAKIVVSRHGAHWIDLASANGSYVNGERAGSDPIRLHTGDRVVLGDEELEVTVRAPARPISDKIPISKPSWPDIQSELEPEDPSSPGTRQGNFLDLVGKIVERAIAEGRLGDAATMVAPQLGKLLTDARGGRRLDPPAREAALRCALALARAEQGGPWLDYAFDLMTALRWAPEGELASEVERVLEAAERVDEARLLQYVTTVETSGDRSDALRVTYWARGLGRALARKSR